MRKPECLSEQKAAGSRERLSRALHDLCQPLTTLQCRLEMAGMLGTMEAYREAVELGLVECERLAASAGEMRELLQADEREAK